MQQRSINQLSRRYLASLRGVILYSGARRGVFHQECWKPLHKLTSNIFPLLFGREPAEVWVRGFLDLCGRRLLGCLGSIG